MDLLVVKNENVDAKNMSFESHFYNRFLFKMKLIKLNEYIFQCKSPIFIGTFVSNEINKQTVNNSQLFYINLTHLATQT